jgi:hypothetical protein
LNIFYLDKDVKVIAQSLPDQELEQQISDLYTLIAAWSRRYQGFCHDTLVRFSAPDYEGIFLDWLEEGMANVYWCLNLLLVCAYEDAWRKEQESCDEKLYEMYAKLQPWMSHFAFMNNTCPKKDFPDVYEGATKDREGIQWGYRRYFAAEKFQNAAFTKRESPCWGEEPKPPEPEPIPDFSTIAVPKTEAQIVVPYIKEKTIDASSIKI